MGCFGKQWRQIPVQAGSNNNGWGYIGLALVWLGVSGGLKALEHTGGVFALNAICANKVLAVAVIWIGRFYCFPQARLQPRAKLWCVLLSLLLTGSGVIRVMLQFSAGYLLLVGVDTVLWAAVVTVFLETLAAVYYQRWTGTAPRSSQLGEQWRLFWRDSLKLGVWLALALGLAFLYLVSFYRFDVYFYSRAMTGLWFAAEVAFYGIAYWRLTSGLRAKLVLLEREIAGYLGWPGAEPGELVAQGLPVLQYLLLSREYLESRRRPVVSGWALTGLVGLGGFLLGLPRLIGFVMKV
jgi:hypothetical protein